MKDYLEPNLIFEELMDRHNESGRSQSGEYNKFKYQLSLKERLLLDNQMTIMKSMMCIMKELKISNMELYKDKKGNNSNVEYLLQGDLT